MALAARYTSRGVSTAMLQPHGAYQKGDLFLGAAGALGDGLRRIPAFHPPDDAHNVRVIDAAADPAACRAHPGNQPLQPGAIGAALFLGGGELLAHGPQVPVGGVHYVASVAP